MNEVSSNPVDERSTVTERFRRLESAATASARTLNTKRATTFELRKSRSSSTVEREGDSDTGKSISSTVPRNMGLITEKSTRHDLKTPRQNLVRSRKDKLQRRPRSRSREFRRPRKVTQELREFWVKLDQRKQSEGKTARNLLREHQASQKVEEHSAKVNDTETEHIYDDFPFLSENYDYSNYYYDFPIDDEKIVPSENQSMLEKKNGNLEEDSIKIPEIFSTTVPALGATTESSMITAALKDAVAKSAVLAPSKLQARKAPDLVTESTDVHSVVVPLTATPMTAKDSFIIKRQSLTRRHLQGQPRDILKEFPIFRHLNRDVPQRKVKKLSLHERLQTRFSTEQPLDSSVVVPESEIVTTQPIEQLSDNLDTQENGTFSELATEVIPVVTETIVTDELGTTEDIPNTTVGYSTVNTTVEVQREITFSTSQTHKVVKSSSPTKLPELESQLGLAPLGETPFGLAPFGFTPMGEKPFGIAPGGLAPLGNSSVTNSSLDPLVAENVPADDSNGRYHVQVVSPDGSINGDYVVVDPVTGDLNGVRYEAAQDVDPQLVQRALLNFLSLDPRLKPDPAAQETPYLATTEEPIPETTQLPEVEEQPKLMQLSSTSKMNTEALETTLMPDVDKTLLL